VSAASAVIGLRMFACGRETPVQARFCYDTADPFEVQMTLSAGLGEPVTWVYARDLLAGGLTAATGDGDVRVWACHGGRTVCIRLWSPWGTAVFEGPAGDVARFVDVTCRLVPAGAEPGRTDLDAGIAAILAQGGAR
jgi:hypothetical protein